MKKKIKSMAAVIMIAVVALIIAATGFWGTAERYLYDLHVRTDFGPAPPQNIVIVAIDDATLDIMADRLNGLQWPYPRAVHARVLENLARLGARIVFFDVLFDIPSGRGGGDDAELEHVLQKVPTILAAEVDKGVSNLPLERFIKAGAIPGNALVPLDVDGVVRDLSGGNGLPKWFLDAIGYFCGGWGKKGHGKSVSAGEELPIAAEAILQLAHFTGRSMAQGGMIRFFGPPGSFKIISFFEIYDKTLAEKYRDDLKGKIVLIGRTLYAPLTPGQQSDLFLTPYRPNFMAGVEIHAHNVADLAASRIVRLVPGCTYPAIFIGWILICVAALGRMKRPLAEFAVLAALIAVIEAAAFSLYHNDYVLLIGPFLLFSGLYFVYTSLNNYIRERDAKLLFRTQLFRYLPKKVADHIMAQPFRMAMAGDRSDITVLFADLAGFTTMAEALPTDKVITLLQNHLKSMTEVIFAHQGTLDKFLGDGIMAFWGAPELQENQADLAVAAALDMQKRVDAENRERETAGLPLLQMRIGLHSGEAIVGNVGSDLYLDYTAIGDTVNTASRTEGINKFFGTNLLVSDACREITTKETRDSMFLAGRVSVKGKKKAMSFYSPALNGESAELFRKLDIIIKLLDNKQIESAEEHLLELITKNPGFGPALFHLDLIKGREIPLYDEEGNHYWLLDKK